MADEDKLVDALIATVDVLRPQECVDHEAVLRWLLAEKTWENTVLAAQIIEAEGLDL